VVGRSAEMLDPNASESSARSETASRLGLRRSSAALGDQLTIRRRRLSHQRRYFTRKRQGTGAVQKLAHLRWSGVRPKRLTAMLANPRRGPKPLRVLDCGGPPPLWGNHNTQASIIPPAPLFHEKAPGDWRSPKAGALHTGFWHPVKVGPISRLGPPTASRFDHRAPLACKNFSRCAAC
jgi:hypothetical protein